MPSDQPTAAPTKPLLAAAKRLLRPLVRLLISKGVGLAAMTELLKDVYVSVAIKDFADGGKEPTDSRVSVMTGVHRKDVKRLRDVPPDDLSAPRTIGLGAQVVARWLGSPETTDSEGRPLPLPARPPPMPTAKLGHHSML